MVPMEVLYVFHDHFNVMATMIVLIVQMKLVVVSGHFEMKKSLTDFNFPVKPTIISPPERQVQINAGETLTLRCTARGAPAPYINWRLNWGHICGDGSDNGRCSMAQSLDTNDPTLITGTLTIRNVNANDAGAYSCEALNNQGFIFAIPDAIVNVIIGRCLILYREYSNDALVFDRVRCKTNTTTTCL